MHRIDAGALRSAPMEIVSGSIGKEKVHCQAPPAAGLGLQVDAFIAWFNASNPTTGTRPMDGLVRAALSHVWFETLHPFDDGNGRIGRAILQLALGQDMGQPGRIMTLSRQIESCKAAYYSALERAQGYIGGMTTREHQSIAQVSTPTAARDLIELEQLGLLVRHGVGRSVRYYPALEGWTE